jgi:hypothetical protein
MINNKEKRDMKKNTSGCKATEHYSSFDELRPLFGLNQLNWVTKDEDKLKNQQENFYKRDKKRTCSVCEQPMTLVKGTSVMICVNPKCNGIKNVSKDSEGNEIVNHRPSFCLLDGKAIDVANNIF